MQLLRPSSSVCFKLKLPQQDPDSSLNETEKRLTTLTYRTGSAIKCFRSTIFVHGGLVIPLNLSNITTQCIQEELMLYFAKMDSEQPKNFDNLNDWISPHLFTLDLITRKWSLFNTSTSNQPCLKRLYHSIVPHEDKLYMFGGLIVSPSNGYELIASNELWELNLITKRWLQFETQPNLIRRYNHSMMIHTDSNDIVRLIIIGGKDNLNNDISMVDIYNLNTGVWESLQSKQKIITNINGNPNGLTKSNNFPVLIQKDPTSPSSLDENDINHKNDSSSSSSTSSPSTSDIPIIVYYNSNNDTTTATTTTTTIPSPIVALPLLPNSQGLRMNSFQDQETLKIPLNLKNISAATFKKGVIITGFYPTTNRSDFHCYVYDLSCAYWTKLAIDCPESEFYHHRFNELFVWNSHHRAILLGTEIDDHMGPTVQRFDHLLSFRLGMMNVLKEVPRYILDHDKGELVPLIPELDKLSTSKRNDSSVSATNSTISQFENYIKYVTTPLELESTSSIFPPYALVLGKDILEIFGKLISDFEFISSTGESVVIPMYLLRKRWGRYFDMLLARAYTKVCQSQDQNYGNSPSKTGHYDDDDDDEEDDDEAINTPKKKSPLADNYISKKHGSFSSRNSDDKLSPSTSTLDLLSTKYSSGTKEKHSLVTTSTMDTKTNKSDVPVFRVPFQDLTSDRKTNYHPTTPNSFSLESNNLSPLKRQIESNQRRSSSVLGSLNNIPENKHNVSNERRASHPVGLLFNTINPAGTSSPTSTSEKNILQKTIINNSILPGRRGSLRILSPTHNSRRASFLSQHTASRRPSVLSQHTTSRNGSILSQTSGLSLVSSSSDRRGINIQSKKSCSNSSFNSFDGSLNSLQFELFNVALPPTSEPPMISLPPTPNGSISESTTTQPSQHYSSNSSVHNHYPHHSNARSRKSSVDYYRSPRHSSFSTRRSSHESKPRSSIHSSRSSSLPDILPGNNAPHHGTNISARSSVSSISSASSFVSLSPLDPLSSSSASGSSLSLNGNEEQLSNTIIDQLDLDPLLTPRSLYMPWPTETVKAFAEFFCTGKVNGKWTLAPTVLDLLVMSQLYEIPLLYDMITEVLYTLIGKKEETLKLTVNNMVNGYIDMMSKVNDGDNDKMESSLLDNENYQELLQLKNSLDNINNGFLDMHILEKYIINKNGERQFSGIDSEISGSTKTYQSEILSMNKNKKKTELSSDEIVDKELSSNHSDVIFAGGPRDSQDSIGSLVYLRHKSIINPLRKRSILSKEFNIDMDPSLNSSPIKQEDYLLGHRDSITDIGEKLKDFKIRGKSVSLEEELEMRERSLSPYTSSDSDIEGEEEYSIGSISSKKIKKELKLEEELDESIDPLLKLNTNQSHINSRPRNASISASTNLLKNSILNQRKHPVMTSTQPPLSRMNSGNSSSKNGDIKDDNNNDNDNNTTEDDDFQNITLESLVSTTGDNSMVMVVDYIIKLIYRTSVMVNDSRLMLRCMDCIEFSSILKRIKRNMVKDYNKLGKMMGNNTNSNNKMKQNKKMSIKINTSVNATNSPVVSPMTRQFPISKRGEPNNSTAVITKESITSDINASPMVSTPSSRQISPRSSIASEKSKDTTTSTSSFPFFGKRKF
ncbi:negative regulator of sporulation Pmd1p [Monosporozyma servazzii]